MTDYKEHQKIVWQNMSYSIQRIDLLIISVSGAGILLCLETLKYMYSIKIPIHYSIKLASALFVLSIIVNFLSQFFSYLSNRYDYLICDIQLCENKTEDDLIELATYQLKCKRFTNFTLNTNYISAAAMFIGLIICFFYFIITF